jgi:hypothetical protein
MCREIIRPHQRSRSLLLMFSAVTVLHETHSGVDEMIDGDGKQ